MAKNLWVDSPDVCGDLAKGQRGVEDFGKHISI